MRGSRPLTKDEVKLVRQMFGGNMAVRNIALFSLGVNTGFRISELLSLTLGDVLDPDGRMKERFTVSKRNMKGKKSSRDVPVNDIAKEYLKPWLKRLAVFGVVNKGDYIFRAGNKNKPISRSQAWRILDRAFKDAGLRGKLGTHSMRKTFANNVYNVALARVAKGESVDAFRLTSKALGHADIKSTDQYLSFRSEDIDSAINQAGA